MTKKVKKVSFEAPILSAGLRKKALIRATQRLPLKLVFHKYLLSRMGADRGAFEVMEHKPALFNFSKAGYALDFNKFLKVNKLTARAVVEMGNDMYSQYALNLQTMGANAAIIEVNAKKKNVHTARVLRKYVQLLHTYFTEVYDKKVSKRIPSSSAMYWVREYLRLTSDMRRRTSL